MSENKIDELLSDLEEEGELHSQGSFTLDIERATLKTSLWHFQDFDSGVLALFPTLLILGAREVHLAYHQKRWKFLAPGAEQQLGVYLERLVVTVYEDGVPGPVRELARTLLGLHPKFCQEIEIRSGNCRYCLTAEGWTKLYCQDSEFSIWLSENYSWAHRMLNRLPGVPYLWAEERAAVWLDSLRYFPLPLTILGKAPQAPDQPPNSNLSVLVRSSHALVQFSESTYIFSRWDHSRWTDLPVSVAAHRVSQNISSETRLALVYRGVELGEILIPARGRFFNQVEFVGAVHATELDFDLTGRQPIMNDKFYLLQKVVRRLLREELIYERVRQFEADPANSDPKNREFLLRFYLAKGKDNPTSALTNLVKQLPLLEISEGGFCSISEVGRVVVEQELLVGPRGCDRGGLLADTPHNQLKRLAKHLGCKVKRVGPDGPSSKPKQDLQERNGLE